MNFRFFDYLTLTLISFLMVSTGGEDTARAVDHDELTCSVIVVQGAGGSPQFDDSFRAACSKIQSAAKKANIKFTWIGGGTKTADSNSDRDLLKIAIESNLNEKSQLWLILIGHGTYSRNAAKFNLRGPDLMAAELTNWLEGSTAPIAIVNCASSSAPFINSLSGPNRIVVTATKSGFEISFARFGQFFAEGITNMEADIDKDEQVSLLESFLFASKKVQEFYKSESRLSTEHALIDDNGDGKGTPLEFFRGVRVVAKSADDTIPDGLRANQLHLIESEFEMKLSTSIKQKRYQLEIEVEKLRSQKSQIPEGEYFEKLELIMTKLAQLYASQEKNPLQNADSNASDHSEKDAENPKDKNLKKDENPSTSKQTKKAANPK